MLVEFLWRVSQDLQEEANDSPMAQDFLRWEEYASKLCDYLFIDHHVGFEAVTLVMSPIVTVTDQDKERVMVLEHTDVMNDNLGGYSRTCVMNICFTINPEVRFLMQVIGNFRKVVGQYMVPFRKSIHSTVLNAETYIDSWKKQMRSVFAGVSTYTHWNPFNRKPFFLDDE